MVSSRTSTLNVDAEVSICARVLTVSTIRLCLHVPAVVFCWTARRNTNLELSIVARSDQRNRHQVLPLKSRQYAWTCCCWSIRRTQEVLLRRLSSTSSIGLSHSREDGHPAARHELQCSLPDAETRCPHAVAFPSVTADEHEQFWSRRRRFDGQVQSRSVSGRMSWGKLEKGIMDTADLFTSDTLLIVAQTPELEKASSEDRGLTRRVIHGQFRGHHGLSRRRL